MVSAKELSASLERLTNDAIETIKKLVSQRGEDNCLVLKRGVRFDEGECGSIKEIDIDNEDGEFFAMGEGEYMRLGFNELSLETLINVITQIEEETNSLWV